MNFSIYVFQEPQNGFCPDLWCYILLFTRSSILAMKEITCFLQTFFIGFIVSLVKRQRSPIEGEVESDDFYDSDDDMLAP